MRLRYDERWVGPRFGVELELVGLRPPVATGAGRVAWRSAAPPRPGLDGVGDRSVPDGFELRTPPLRHDELSALRVALAGLRRAGGRAADARTGLHVHVDANGLTPPRLATLGLAGPRPSRGCGGRWRCTHAVRCTIAGRCRAATRSGSGRPLAASAQ